MTKTPVVVPDLGNEIDEAQVETWLKGLGDAVAEGEPLLTLTTPKVSLEIEAPVSGTLMAMLVEADDIVSVGDELAAIESA